MKVFISWSEARSKAVAEALYNWLPTIIQPVRPWMSEHDIDKGTRGLPAISRQLEETQFGIICLTPENLGAPWLLFEAGALSKSQDAARVWTLLYDLEYVGVQGPLAQFQHTKAEKEDVRKLLAAINTAAGEPLITDEQLRVAFDRGWGELEEKLQGIPAADKPQQPQRSDRELIEESLTLLRKIAAREDTGFIPRQFSWASEQDPLSVYDDTYRSHTMYHYALTSDESLASEYRELKHRFKLVESGSLPPIDLSNEGKRLLERVVLRRAAVERSGLDVSPLLRELHIRVRKLNADIEKYVKEERQRYVEPESTASEEG